MADSTSVSRSIANITPQGVRLASPFFGRTPFKRQSFPSAQLRAIYGPDWWWPKPLLALVLLVAAGVFLRGVARGQAGQPGAVPCGADRHGSRAEPGERPHAR